MAKKSSPKDKKIQITTLTHEDATRRNIPPAEYQSMLEDQQAQAVPVTYPRPGTGELGKEAASREPDLDPQLIWRGKDQAATSDLVVQAPPLYIQEKVHPKALVDDLRRQSEAADIAKKIAAGKNTDIEDQLDLFADFNGLPDTDAKTEFYQHDQHWSNRMILGDSLQVMASLSEREGLRGKVQCIYFDPPYGIKFNSNFQWSTTSRDVKDGNKAHITREPEMVKAFRDTWRDGIHSYLTYLRDRLIAARDLLTESGSIFVQIGDENVHRVRAVMDEVFGEDNCVAVISYAKTTGFSGRFISSVTDYILWYGKSINNLKYRALYVQKEAGDDGASKYRAAETIKALLNTAVDLSKFAVSDQLTSQGASANSEQRFTFEGESWLPPAGLHWKTTVEGMSILARSGRVMKEGKSLRYLRFIEDFAINPRTNVWPDIGGIQSRSDPKVYVVQTATEAIKRCLLMATDPGDLVLDPTCGSGTTAYVAEQWGRRWITIDTSRVAMALARARIMGARYPYYLLADSKEGQQKEAEVTRTEPSMQPAYDNIRHGFVYERVPHVTLKSIANNTEIDVIWEKFQARLEPLREALNKALSRKWEEWEIPRDAMKDWPKAALEAHARWWEQRIQRQKEIDASIAAKADFEYLYDRPYEDKKKVRVAGPFTVESVSPHRMLGVDENDKLIDPVKQPGQRDERNDFTQMVLENLKLAGVQQVDKKDRINFTMITPWAGHYIAAEGHYVEGDPEDGGVTRRAGIFIGPEFGTVSRQHLVEAAREAADAQFDVVIACAFNYEAHATEFNKLGKIPVLKARMNADLHMADDLKNTGKGNLFVIFGEPDIDILPPEDAQKNFKPGDDLSNFKRICVRINGVDVFKPQTGEVESSSADDIACWFIDTNYNGESFFVRQAYFLGANDPYKSLKTTLKAEINKEAWESLHSAVSRPFDKPEGKKIAVKVINHLGDEVMKVFNVE